MTSASKTSPDVGSCVSPEDLKQYLNGWCDDADAERIEAHLAACSTCEQALRELEIKPDTLLQSLQSTTVEKAPADDNAVSPNAEQPINAALAKARKLMDAPAESPKSTWQPASKELGVYELLRPLGRGGMGAVYLANHRQLHKHVAIKLLPVMFAEDSDVRARFQREIRVVGKLNHPSIVAATDAGEIDGTQFLVMEYVPGMDLSRLARLLGKLSVADACELMRQVALGLSCAHAEGVVHRDVKPSNLMLDETGRIRILDFGLAQLSYWDEASIELTSVGQLMGTLDYMAPEQAELCGGVDYRADLYAMGATLFRLLCGRPPLAAAPNQSPLEKLRLLANHQPPKLDTLCPEAPPELVKLVASLLARSPQDRPASAAHVAEELAAFTSSANAASADLVTLLKRAQEKEAQSPELIVSDRNRRDFMPAMVPAVDGELQDGERRSTGGLTPPRSPENVGRSRIGRWIVAAIFPLLVVAGILIMLETDKGQLVIESDVADVKVSIINDGKPVSELTINHGITATRLRADKYEVVINGPSDGLTIENDQFTLKNGATIVARIRSKKTVDNPSTALAYGNMQDHAPSIVTTEPLYDGKTLDQWLEMLSRERSPAGLKSALDACTVLVSPDRCDQITETLLEILPALDGNMNLENSVTLDSAAKHLLWKANPGPAYFRRWVAVFDAADDAWKKRLWNFLYNLPNDSVETLEPFVVWAANRLSEEPSVDLQTDVITMQAADFLRDITRPNSTLHDDDALIDRVERLLTQSPQLKTSWWLSRPLVIRRDDSDIQLWSKGLQREIIRHAIITMQEDDTNPSMVAHACVILANGAELNTEQKKNIQASVARRLTAACESPQALTAMVQTEDTFHSFCIPELLQESPLNFVPLQVENSIFYVDGVRTYQNSVVIQLLNLAFDLDQGQSIQSNLARILQATRDTLEIINPQRLEHANTSPDRGPAKFRSRPSGGIRVELDWPALKISSHIKRPQRTDMAALIWGEHKPTPTDWHKYLILLHPVMKDTVDAALAKPEPAAAEMPAENRPTPEPKVPDQ